MMLFAVLRPDDAHSRLSSDVCLFTRSMVRSLSKSRSTLRLHSEPAASSLTIGDTPEQFKEVAHGSVVCSRKTRLQRQLFYVV